MRGIFAVARAHGHGTLVLSAFGCGEFGNPPRAMAAAFVRLLGPGGEFHGAFRRVVFAILRTTTAGDEQTQRNYDAFRAAVEAVAKTSTALADSEVATTGGGGGGGGGGGAARI